MEISVVIPTRNRPSKLQKCLEALEKAREFINFTVFVCDSSTDDETYQKVVDVCGSFDFVKVFRHEGKNVAAARNTCAKVATGDVIVNVDDDIYVEPQSILKLYNKYISERGWRVVAGSVAWSNDWSTPVIMRPIGYARKIKPGEKPSFIIGAFFIYSKDLANSLPWNERVRTSDDRFMGALWRSKGIQMLFEPDARAFHDHQHTSYEAEHYESHIYVNMFDAIISNFNFSRILSYQVLGFLAGVKQYRRNLGDMGKFVRSWFKGNYKFIKDLKYLYGYKKLELENNVHY
ncbi:glycosyltransferase family 2 protein [Paenibacillus cookii]|jgi:glycosyltransferase involved in cell wall biosynthesis|uniref:Glycosyltransferase 2-like domain-containing protein n=1 Tax=Paenibacillus cookii TaxID=157839 RepID=A0ABQ4LYV0_9BACL|nr:glycosyltransferase family 2 protein [Paenibacillus cookii]GIO68384.1 hypothetical protein J21TS3_32050 [Paenibacillus cookii]